MDYMLTRDSIVYFEETIDSWELPYIEQQLTAKINGWA